MEPTVKLSPQRAIFVLHNGYTLKVRGGGGGERNWVSQYQAINLDT